MNIKKKLILIVDDAITNLKNAEEVLKEKYCLALAKSGKEALEFLDKSVPDLILLDVLMPEISGFEVMEKINASDKYGNVPVIFLTIDHSKETEIKGFELGAQDFITKPFVPETMICRIERILELDMLRKNLEKEVSIKTKQVEQVTLHMLTAVAKVVDKKNGYTYGHSIKTAKYAEEIAKRLGFAEDEIEKIHYNAILHDIGMISVPDAILNNAQPLNKTEWDIVKKHNEVGYNILKDLTVFGNIADGALYHQERFDGSGYPSGLKNEEIPIVGRIIAAASAYDAMNSDRAYRARLTKKQIHEELLKESGKQFDPVVVDIVVGMLEDNFIAECVDECRAGNSATDAVDASGEILHKIISEYTEEKKNEALRDSLTNLWNRQYAEEKINEFLSQKDGSGIMLMFDMDNFKYINDTFGHIIGDKILIKIAQMLNEGTRQDDIICRLGGDEFIVFLKDIATPKIIEAKTEEIFNKISDGLRGIVGDDMATVSVGVAVAPKDGKKFIDLYNSADKSLYYVKQNGKGEFHYYSGIEGSVLKQGETENVLEKIKGGISCNDETKGAYHVPYDGFKNIYTFVERFIARVDDRAQVMLFTLREAGDTQPSNSQLNEAVEILRKSIQFQLRRGDVFTRFSDNQFVVILMNIDSDKGNCVAERVINKYLSETTEKGITVEYDIQGLDAEN